VTLLLISCARERDAFLCGSREPAENESSPRAVRFSVPVAAEKCDVEFIPAILVRATQRTYHPEHAAALA